jgi:uncharacterized membrane protein/nitrite reductase/ring-hydroxylating ferredoxin subunit
MKSKASFKSHPLHPILICFPVAFFTATVIADYIRIIFVKDELAYTCSLLNIAGIAGAIIAAIPGLVDFIYTVPPKSSGKKRAAKHAITNSTMLVLFIIAWFIRNDPNVNPVILLLIETIALVLMAMAGWMGGTLVYRNQIGVDMRYANAKKWNEEFLNENINSPVDLGSFDNFGVNQMKLIHIGKKRIVIGRTEEKFVAFADRCSHKGGSLAGGSMMCGKVQCPWHGSQFNTFNGEVEAGPAKEPVPIYKIETVNGKLFLYF